MYLSAEFFCSIFKHGIDQFTGAYLQGICNLNQPIKVGYASPTFKRRNESFADTYTVRKFLLR